MKRLTGPVPHFLIVGGGAGGLELAIQLARRTGRGRRARVTLLDRAHAHIWKPRLHEIAVGLLVLQEEQASYAAQARQHGFDFVLGALEGYDSDRGVAHVAPVTYPRDLLHPHDAELLPAREIAFDTLVLAVGSTVNDFGTPGVAEHCYALNTANDAERLHRALLAAAARVAAGVDERMRVAIVGGGTTGVELAGELRTAARELAQYRSLLSPDHLDITVVEMADRLLPGSDAETSAHARAVLEHHRVALLLGAKVAEVDADALHLADGRTVASDLTVWASGVRGPALLDRLPGLVIEKGHRIRTDATLRAARPDGGVHPTLYAMGDCAACFEEGADTPVGATAQAAHQQARLLARSLAGQMRGREPLAFRYRPRGTLVSLGEGSAVGVLPRLRGGKPPLRIAGLPAKVAYTMLYRAHMAELFGWWRTAALTASGWLRRQAMPAVKLSWD